MVLCLNMLKRTKKGHKSEDTWTGPYKVLSILIIIWMLSPAVHQNKHKNLEKSEHQPVEDIHTPWSQCDHRC